ncbi:MAG: glutamate--tRNA ligase [Desulfarculales bacterium]|jgi:glutamyl-tRNA synthetase|nr:glutamate--tRNA ligase [Desulfarculales bacterium]
MNETGPKIKTRFPPSPTGALHLGGARTALFNWLFARHHGGSFVFRLEDTDRQRSKDEYAGSIIAAMRWLGLDYDEGPYYQSQRFDRYRQAVDCLLDSGRAYWCHCSPQDLERQRAQAHAAGQKPRYNGACRERNLGPAPGAVARLKTSPEGTTGFADLVKGDITFANNELDDLIILRSDNSPTYHLAVVVDDIDMGITHVIRGDDHISNTPRQILIYQALGAKTPLFAHVPMILGPDKGKLSKRHGATAVIDYEEEGYLPQAILNMLARLGWSHGDQEIFSLDELINLFDLKAVGSSPSVFDHDRLLNLNHHYIQRSDPADLVPILLPFLARAGVNNPDRAILLKCLPHIMPRGRTLKELAHWAEPYLLDQPRPEAGVKEKFLTPAHKPLLQQLLEVIEANQADPEPALKRLSQETGLKPGNLLPILRAALTGRNSSPGIYQVMDILGMEKTLARIRLALAEID